MDIKDKIKEGGLSKDIKFSRFLLFRKLKDDLEYKQESVWLSF